MGGVEAILCMSCVLVNIPTADRHIFKQDHLIMSCVMLKWCALRFNVTPYNTSKAYRWVEGGDGAVETQSAHGSGIPHFRPILVFSSRIGYVWAIYQYLSLSAYLHFYLISSKEIKKISLTDLDDFWVYWITDEEISISVSNLNIHTTWRKKNQSAFIFCPPPLSEVSPFVFLSVLMMTEGWGTFILIGLRSGRRSGQQMNPD